MALDVLTLFLYMAASVITLGWVEEYEKQRRYVSALAAMILAAFSAIVACVKLITITD